MKNVVALVLIMLAGCQVKSQSMDSYASGSDSSSGWISFELSHNQIYVPVSINGHPAIARLFDAVQANRVDADFLAAQGIELTGKAGGDPPIVALNIRLGRLPLRQAIVAAPFQHISAPTSYDIMLGDDIFKHYIVDIDFPDHKIAFYHPNGFTPPSGAVTLPYTQQGDDRAVPASLEGGAEMYFWVYLGDPAPLSVYANCFGPLGMSKDRPHSVRQGGGTRRPPEAIATAHAFHFAGTELVGVPAVLPDDSVTGPHPANVGGHIGIGTLSRFRVIFDYAHDRFYVISTAALKLKAPFAKDRSGLVLKKVQDDYIVTFVCPGSPAMKAGFRPQDTVIRVDDQSLPALEGIAWQLGAWSSVLPTAVGKTYSFMLKDGTIRRLVTAEFF
jgi:hypothetical protein